MPDEHAAVNDDEAAMDGGGGGGGAASSDRMRGRVTGSRFREWLLLTANRHVVTGGILGLLFATFVVLGALDPVGIRSAMAGGDPIETAFQGILAGIITGVTLVVTINQLVLSQELGAVGDQRERMEGAMSFRREAEDVLGLAVAPADPAAFLRAVVDATRERAEALADAGAEIDDVGRRERTRAYANELSGNARSVSRRLDGAEFGSFDVVHAALDFDYSSKIHEGRMLREAADETAAVESALLAVVEALELFGPAREHVKTLYFQWELIDLSRAVLYAALPALVVAVGMILFVGDPNTVPGATLGVDHMVWVVSAAATVALAPFVLLLAYILRIATVAKRTLAIGPFVLRGTGGDGPADA